MTVADLPAGRSLADLARSGDQRHLAMPARMISQHPGIKTVSFLHGDHYLAHRKMVQTILR